MSSQGFDPNNPSPWGAGQPAAPGGNDALGFESAPKQEKYNTQYLASTITKQRRTGQYIVLGVIGAVLLAMAVVALTRDEAPPHKPPAAAAEPSAPAGESAKAAAAPAEQPK